MDLDESGQVINYLTEENKVTIQSTTSESSGNARNVCNSNDKQLWLSDNGMPQSITFDISEMKYRPTSFQSFGWHCWHSYSSNPAAVDLYVSEDGEMFSKWATFHAEMRAGNQIFVVDPISNNVNYLKLEVIETFGAAKTYVNQVFLFEDVPRIRKTPEPASLQATPARQVETPLTDQKPPAPRLSYTEPKQSIGETSELKSQLSQQLMDMETKINDVRFESETVTSQAFMTPSKSMQQWGTMGTMHTVDTPVQQASPTPMRLGEQTPMYIGETTPIRIGETPLQQRKQSDTPLRDAIVEEQSELRSLKQQVKRLESSISDIAESVQMLNRKVSKIKETKQAGIAHTLKSFKENILQDLNGSTTSISSKTNESWEKNMAMWQAKVLEPQLNNLSQSLENKMNAISIQQTPKSNVADIMSALHNKLAEKAAKLERLEVEHTKSARRGAGRSRSPEFSDTSSEFIRFKTPTLRYN